MNNYIKNNTGILIRIDDVCENMDWELMRKLELLFDNYSIKPVLGVIPNNKDKEFLSFPRNIKIINFCIKFYLAVIRNSFKSNILVSWLWI